MKNTRKLLNWLVACGVALAMVSTLNAQTMDSSAKVVRIKGSARYSTGNNVWQPLKVGQVLKQGTIVQTASGSMVDMVLGEGATGSVAAGAAQPSLASYTSYQPKVQRDVVRMVADTVLAIDKLTQTDTGADKVTDTELDLRAGKILAAVKKVSAASTFEIKIPNGVAGIRGTIVSVSASGVIAVLQGTVTIAYNTPQGPQTKTIEALFEFDTRTGELTRIVAANEMELKEVPREVQVSKAYIAFPPDNTYKEPSSLTGVEFVR